MKLDQPRLAFGEPELAREAVLIRSKLTVEFVIAI